MLVAVATAQNEPEAEMICARLAGDGIEAVYKRGIGADLPQLGGSGVREVFVDEGVAARARELLSVPEFSDEELAELSARAADGLAGGSPE